MADLTRREFVIAAATTAAGLCLYRSSPAWANDKGPVNAGTLADYVRDGVSDRFAKSNGFLIVRHEGKLYAPSALCTHRRCTVKAAGDAIACPCHGSRFDLNGVVTQGPAKRTLPRLGIALVDGRVKVDPSKQFTDEQWTDPASFIKLD